MANDSSAALEGIKKRGGYSGARSASSMKPPAKLPTGARVASPRADDPQAPKSR